MASRSVLDARALPMGTFTRYMLFQTPGYAIFVAVALWLWPRIGWPLWTLGVAGVFWVAKDVVLYPLVREAYSGKTATGAQRLVGASGVVQAPLAPAGRIRVAGESWRARSADGGNVGIGVKVVVVAADGLTLVVSSERACEPSR